MSWPPTAPPPPSSLPPPGWYPDPSGQSTHRWWDGTAWTVHTGMPPSQAKATGLLVMTRGGTVELSGWWRRLGGYVLDSIIVAVPGFIIGLIIGSADVATQAPVGTDGRSLSVGGQVAVVVTSLVITLGYPFLLLRYRGQTVGMMAAGVRAVDSESGAPLTTAQTWQRVLAFFFLVTLWDQIAAVIAFGHVGVPAPASEVLLRLLSVVALVTTALWPLGSSRNQTLQDKIASTIVIRTLR